MKRSTDSGSNPPKRPKIELGALDPFDAAPRTKARDVCKNGTDGTGFLSGKAFMVWPVGASGVCRVQMETEDDGQVERFELKLSGRCRKHFDRLNIISGDRFEILLKGAGVEVKNQSSKPFYLPLVLTFIEGVVFKFTHRVRIPVDVGVVIDTWKCEFLVRKKFSEVLLLFFLKSLSNELNSVDEADREEKEFDREREFWFNTPVSPLPERLISGLQKDADADADAPDVPEPDSSINVRRVFTSHNRMPLHDSAGALSRRSTSPAQQMLPPPLPTNRADKPAQPEKNEIHNSRLIPPQNVSLEVPIATLSKLSDPQPQQGVSSILTTETAPPQIKLTKKQQRLLKKQRKAMAASKPPLPDVNPSGTTSSNELSLPVPSHAERSSVLSDSDQNGGSSKPDDSHLRDPVINMRAGFRNEVNDVYTALQDIKSGSSPINVIGIVTSIRGIQMTRTNDLSCTLTIVDPSILDVNNVFGHAEGLGHKVNCFTAKHAGWLPAPQFGDVLILRAVKATNFQGNISLVGYKDKLKWAIYNAKTGLVHHGDRGGAPDSEGLDGGYGYDFTPFWTASQAELVYCLRLTDWWLAALKVVRSNMGQVHQVESGSSHFAPSRRIHRLISDASPDTPPNGFFDCTVEILYRYLNENNACSVYVTDYTHNSIITPVQANWCPPELADRVLKIEMWDSASQLAQTMEKGEYWFLYNTRMKISPGGYVEGTMQLVEKVKKLEESDSIKDQHFIALLQRKQEWEARDHSLGGDFEHRLFENIQPNQHFDCTVEVIHAEYCPNDVSFIFITDYTQHRDLPVITTPWSQGLEKYISKVVLIDGQAEMARTVEPGNFYIIRKLRMTHSTTGNQFQGRLGGAERLIHKLNKESNNSDLKALFLRKEIWLQKLDVDHMSSHPRPGFNSIKEILSNDRYPKKVQLVAHIKDFYPRTIEEFVVLRCKQCQEDLPATRKQCVKCYNMVDNTVEFIFVFFFRLEDEEGEELVVSVADEECSLLRGLEPADLRDDPESLKVLKDRLKPFIGNLVEVHDWDAGGGKITTDTPSLNVVIDCWKGEEDTVCYGLMDVSLAP